MLRGCASRGAEGTRARSGAPRWSEHAMTSTPKGLRNLAFVGHPSAGKTTLVDALAHS